MLKAIDLSLIIVSHEHADYLPTSLGAISAAAPDLDYEVIVVDNRSSDGSPDVAARTRPDATVLVNERRRGFSANCNAGLARSTGRKVLLLNPDTEAAPGSITTMVRFLDENPDIGVLGPQLRFPDGSIQPSCRRFPTIGSAIARRTPLRRALDQSTLNTRHLMLDVDHNQTRDVDWMLGACLMARREAIDDVGPLDERFYLYVEDIDWCLRMHQRGWRVVYHPAAQVTHHHLAVTDHRWLTWRTAVHAWGMVRFITKHGMRAPATVSSGQTPSPS